MATDSLLKPQSSLSATDMTLPVSTAVGTDEHAAFEEEVVGFFVDAAEILGVPRSVAAIYGVIFASPVPLSFSDIESRVSFSKGSVSQGLRVLREIGAIKKAEDCLPNSDLPSPISGRASKARDHYEPDMELRKLIKHFLETRLQSQLNSGSSRLARIEAAITDEDNEESQILRDRTKYLISWHKKARALLPIIRSAMMLVPKK